MKLDEAKKIIKDMNLSREDIIKILDMVEPDIITITKEVEGNKLSNIKWPYEPTRTDGPYPPYPPTWYGTEFTCNSNLTLDKAM